MSVRRAHVRISGRVQGVSFRFEALRRADSLGIAGWIRNLPDASVEAVFEGDEERVQSLVEWCRRGPRGAVVDSVEIAEERPTGEARFEVR